jgi:hypothetical protein
MGAVAAIPFVVLVIVLAELPKVFVVAGTIPDKFTPPDAIPFIVDVKVVPLKASAFVFTMGAVAAIPLVVLVIVLAELPKVFVVAGTIDDKFTPPDATPFIVDVKVVPLKASAFVFTIGAVAATPLVVLVNVFTALLNVLVVAAATTGVKFNPPDAIPLMVDVKVVPLNDSAFVFTMGAVAAIPLVVLVIVFAELPKVFVVAGTIPDKFTPPDATPFIVDVKVVPLNASAFVFTIGAVAATPLVVLVNVFAELPKVFVVAGTMEDRLTPPDATPLIVEVKLVPLKESALELMIETPLPDIPFTEVDNTLLALELLTPFIMFTEAPTPLVVLVNMLFE